MRGILDKKNKKGDFTGLLYMVIMIAATAFFLILAGYIGNEISTELQDKINSSGTPEINESFQATENVSNNTLSAIWYVVFGGMLIGLLITSWYIPTHPVMVAPFIILLIIAVIIGVAMSNAYEKLYEVPQLSDIASTQGSIEFMMSKLPYIALVVGVIVLIVTFAKPKGDEAPTG